MEHDRGPKIGWMLGGIGSQIWLIAMAVIFFLKGDWFPALAGVGFFVLGIVYIYKFMPWKYENTTLRKIYLGLFSIIFSSAAVMLILWPFYEPAKTTRAFYLIYLLPGLIPVITFGKKTWKDMHGKKTCLKTSTKLCCLHEDNPEKSGE